MTATSERPLTLFGFDYGQRRTGVAVGNTATRTATPVATVDCYNGEPDWNAMDRLIAEWRPHALVVGAPGDYGNAPTNPAGDRRHLTRRIERFCAELAARYAVPVHTVDETLTSVEAYRHLKQERRSGRPGKIARSEVDMLAAALLLETWMQMDRQDRAAQQ